MAVVERRGQRLRAALQALVEHPAGLPYREVWEQVCRLVPPLPEDLDRTKSGRQRAEVDLSWYGINLVKAGWLRKEHRRWFLTDEGRLALAEYPDPEKFGRVAEDAYQAWDRSRDKSATPDVDPTDNVLPYPGTEPVIAAATTLLQRGLRDGGSAFAEGRSAWSPAAAQELYVSFVERPDASGADFIAKLHRQLDGCSDDAVLLTAELLTLNVLPLSNVSAAAKRARIRTVLSWLKSPVQTPPDIDAAFEHGVFSGGVGFNVSIWKMLSLLINLVKYWQELPAADRLAAFDDPWIFKRVVQECAGPNMPSQREALLFLAHPDTFLPIVKGSHKRAIRDAFAEDLLVRSAGDIDRDLLQITVALQADQHGPVHFYQAPHDRWRPTVTRKEETEGEPVSRRAWLIRGSSVNGHNLVPSWLSDGLVSLAATNLRPVEPDITRGVLKKIVDEDYGHKSYAARKDKVTEFFAFLSRMRDGDLVATTSAGAVHLGTVTGPAEFIESDDGRSNLRRAVTWHSTEVAVEYAALPAPLPAKLSSQADVVDLTEELPLLVDLLGDGGSPQVELVLKDADDALAETLLVDRGWLQEVIELLRDRRQLIFYGPPGTGKTYLAQHLAWHLTEPNAVKLVQFHPSYSYEDFFEGYRPSPGDDGKLTFDLKPGPFRRIVEAARQDLSTPYVLIIDEINRANLAKVFGELYFLLEYRDQAVGLLYSAGDEDDFTLPENVFLIGTMNTADRSIALIDAAMRRRFAFVSLHPADEPVHGLLNRWLSRHGLPDEAAALLSALNARVPDADFAIGPSYLMRPSVYADGGLERVWRSSIMPLLEELHYGDGVDLPGRYGLAALRRSLATAPAADPAPIAIADDTAIQPVTAADPP